MRHFYISEMDARAEGLARACGTGLETIAFCAAEQLEDEDFICAQAQRLKEFERICVHAPYYELAPCAIDPMVRGVAMLRMRQAARVCARLGRGRMVAHSGYNPLVYYPEWFVPKSIEFWKEFVEELPGNFELMVENVLDVRPEYLRDVCDGVGDERMRICLDVGHANAYSDVPVEEWIAILGRRIGHIHLHNNFGVRDEHNALDRGRMDMDAILDLIEAHAPEADICIESMDAYGCLRYLAKRGDMDDESLQNYDTGAGQGGDGSGASAAGCPCEAAGKPGRA